MRELEGDSRERPWDDYWIVFGTPVLCFVMVFVALFGTHLWMHFINGALIGGCFTILGPLFDAEHKQRTRKRQALMRANVKPKADGDDTCT